MTPLMMVATFHFASALDAVNLEPAGLSEPGPQAELEGLAADLARFAPTKVLIESPYAERDRVDADYRAWRAGTRPLGASEREQIGFRVAARAGNDHVYPVDILHQFTDPAFEALIGGDGPAARHWARLLDAAQAATAAVRRTLEARGLRAALAELNAPQALRDDLARYLGGICRICGQEEGAGGSAQSGPGDAASGAAASYAGADLTGRWYHRNLRIFANILRVTEPQDRLLLVYGAGHVPVLRHFAEASGAYALIDPLGALARRA